MNTMMVVKVVLFYLMLARITEEAPAVVIDYMQLVHTWPPSLCDVKNCITTQYTELFTIHGLWPERIGVYLRRCTNESYNLKIDELIPRIKTDWMPLARNDLWEHEWVDHGTCTGFDIFKYFELTLAEFGKFNLKDALEVRGIKPGTNSTPRKISDAIKDATKFRPRVHCHEGRTRGPVLLEVSLCYDRTATVLQDCPKPHYCNCTGKEFVELVQKNPTTGNEPVPKDEL